VAIQHTYLSSSRREAIRETYEEAGIHIELKGILGIEYNPIGLSSHSNNHVVRMRVIFFAEPKVDTSLIPKSIPDFESAGACWCSYEQIHSNDLKLRGSEPRKWTKLDIIIYFFVYFQIFFILLSINFYCQKGI
jgi:8-oxo-dGTP pyrophosphatase MutT (NUDIX family)